MLGAIDLGVTAFARAPQLARPRRMIVVCSSATHALLLDGSAVPRWGKSALRHLDGSAAASAGWDKSALLRGYENSVEIAACEVPCPNLPQDLVGTYYRNGPSRFVGYDGRKCRHPFDADGMVTAVTLDGRSGKAVVRQRYVATDGAIAERRAARALYPGIFGNPLPLWSGGASVKNLANTNVMYHGGKLLALYEGGKPHLLDALSLATFGEWDVDGIVGGGKFDGFSAHPRTRPDGSLCSFASKPNLAAGTTTCRFWDIAAGSFALQSAAQVHELPGYGLFHDFLVTDSWFILLAPPASFGTAGSHLRTAKQMLDWVCRRPGRPPPTHLCQPPSFSIIPPHQYPQQTALLSAPIPSLSPHRLSSSRFLEGNLSPLSSPSTAVLPRWHTLSRGLRNPPRLPPRPPKHHWPSSWIPSLDSTTQTRTRTL
jgi:hypothetical protein